MSTTALAGLRFEESSHSYFEPGEIWIPGVTRVLADQGYSKGSAFFTPASRQRGQAVHYACQLADQHCPELTDLGAVLDVIDLDERLHEYLAGYLMFKREKGFTPQENERLLWSRTMHVAGTMDKWGVYADGRRVLADLKSWKSQGARPKRAAELQVAAYDLMAEECLGLKTDLRVVIALPGNGKYRSYDCTKAGDKAIFRANAVAWWDRKSAGLLDSAAQESEVEIEA